MKGGHRGRDWVMNLNIKAITLPAHCRAGWRGGGVSAIFKMSSTLVGANLLHVVVKGPCTLTTREGGTFRLNTSRKSPTRIYLLFVVFHWARIT
jgi:hypothetical protein